MAISPVDVTRYAEALRQLYIEVERAILDLIRGHLARGIDTPEWARERLAALHVVLREVEQLLNRLTAVVDRAVGETLGRAAEVGGAQAVEDLSRVGRAARAVPGSGAVDSLARDTAGRLTGLRAGILRASDDVYREAVAAGSAPVLAGVETRREATQRVLDRLADRGITGFVDRAGRRWGLPEYAEMAMRTATARAAVAGHVERLQAGGITLVVVSDAPRECPLCRPWEGKVLSLTGAVPITAEHALTGEPVRVEVAGALDRALAAGLFHPNCRHSLSAYLPGVTRRPPAHAEAAGYEATQRQRAMERHIRRWRHRETVAMSPQARTRARAKVRAWQAALAAHVKRHDLKRLRHREQVVRAH